MSRTVRDKLDQALRFVQSPQYGLDHFQVGALIMSADIIYFTFPSLMDHKVYGLTVVRHMKPVPYIFAGAVYRKLLIRQGTADNKRDQLFRKMIRAVVIGAARNSHRQSIGPVVSQHKQVGTGLG